MGGMGSSVIVEVNPSTDPVSGIAAACKGVQIDALVFEESP